MVRTGLAAAIALTIWSGGLGSPAAAADLPVRKPGLWEIKIKLTGGVAPTAMMRHCTDESTDREMITLFNPLAPQPCPKNDIQKHADRYTIDSVCRTDNKTTTLHSDITGDFTSSYSVVTETRIQDQPDSEPAVSNMTLEGKYLGACKSGQTPGDVMMAGGMKINIKDMDHFRKMLKR